MLTPIIQFLTKPTIVFYTVPWLMVLLVLGTVAQRYIGLYEAERLFFSAWVLWLGPVPLPGTYSVLTLITLSLLLKILLKSPWNRKQSGIIITHLGVLLLLIGGLLTALTSEEGYISLGEGETSHTVSDYHLRELAILKNGVPLYQTAHSELRAGMAIEQDDIPFTVRIEMVCRNCQPKRLEEVPEDHRGLAEKVIIEPEELQKEDESNQAGVLFRVNGLDEGQNGLYMAFEPTPHQPHVIVGDDRYTIAMRKVQRALPFSITLEAFEKQVHPGTVVAREYQSMVTIEEGEGVRWKRLIRMNEPLRVQGYTLYQSSFVQARGGEFSVLSVVKNHGRVFPYIASFVIGIGLIIHAVMRTKKKRGARA